MAVPECEDSQVYVEILAKQAGADAAQCSQACPGCEHALKRTIRRPAEGFTPDSLEGLRLIQKFVAARSDRIVNLKIPVVGVAPGDLENLALDPFPDSIGLTLGDPFAGLEASSDRGALIERIVREVNSIVEQVRVLVRKTGAPIKLSLDIVPSLQEADGEIELANFRNVFLFFQSLMKILLEKFPDKFKSLNFTFDNNWVDPLVFDKVLADPTVFLGDVESILKGLCHVNEIQHKKGDIEVDAELGAVFYRGFSAINNVRIGVLARLIERRKTDDHNTLDDALRGEMILTFLPTEVLFNHNTRHMADRSTYLTYPEFAELVARATAQGTDLLVELVERVVAKRKALR